MLLSYFLWAVLAVLTAMMTHQVPKLEDDDLTIVNGVLCHLASPAKTGGAYSEGGVFLYPTCDPLVGPDKPASSPFEK